MIIYQLLVLLAAASLGRAEYKWTGTEWVYVEPDREEKDRNYEVCIYKYFLLLHEKY